MKKKEKERVKGTFVRISQPESEGAREAQIFGSDPDASAVSKYNSKYTYSDRNSIAINRLRNCVSNRGAGSRLAVAGVRARCSDVARQAWRRKMSEYGVKNIAKKFPY